MKTLQFYKYATFILLALNIGLIVFSFVGRPKGKKGAPQLRAIETLGLDEAQHDIFLASAKRHQTQMISISEQQKELLMPYFNSIVDTTLIVNTDSILKEVEQLERSKVAQTYQHFSEIKSILNADQIDDFEGFMDRILAKSHRRIRRISMSKGEKYFQHKF